MAGVGLAGRKAKSRVPLRALPEQPPPFVPPGPVGAQFMDCDDFVRCIRGPFGSGKTVLCVHEILKRAQQQKPYVVYAPSGEIESRRRATRAGSIVRNTFPELKLTTVKTWLRWVPEQLGHVLVVAAVCAPPALQDARRHDGRRRSHLSRARSSG